MVHIALACTPYSVLVLSKRRKGCVIQAPTAIAGLRVPGGHRCSDGPGLMAQMSLLLLAGI